MRYYKLETMSQDGGRKFAVFYYIIIYALLILLSEVDMKETGIVRRIDELGRVVIPKELRKVLKLKEGELLEIFTNDKSELVFKKYNEVGATQDQLDVISKILYKNTGKEVAICDTSSILSHCGGKDELQGEEISEELYGVLDDRKARLIKDKTIRLADDMDKANGEQYIVPIISSGDLYGGIILSADKLGSVDMALCDAMAQYLTYNIG